MYINRNVAWTSTKVDLPQNNRDVTAVARSPKGVVILGAWYNSEEEHWVETYTNTEITHEVICWADIEIPEQRFI